jgi:two-component system, chemotaxis family, chemotaxis protein CheY
MNIPLELPSLRILVIEDETFMRRLILRVLNELGIKLIEEAENGAEGLTQINKSAGRLDLIICDLEMPIMNGLKFIENLRQGKAGDGTKDIPVIILTGHSDEDNIQTAVQLGIQGFLVKPISSAALEKRIKSSVGASVINPALLSPKR